MVWVNVHSAMEGAVQIARSGSAPAPAALHRVARAEQGGSRCRPNTARQRWRIGTARPASVSFHPGACPQAGVEIDVRGSTPGGTHGTGRWKTCKMVLHYAHPAGDHLKSAAGNITNSLRCVAQSNEPTQEVNH